MRRPNEPRGATATDRVPPDVVEACKRGDQQAWNRFVEVTHRDVYALCLRILRDPSDAADATQDAYVKAWRGISGFRGDAQVETWLYRVASNAALSRLRSRSRRKDREVGVDDESLNRLPSSVSVEERAATKLDVRAVEAALERLPEHYRAAVVLRDIYGFHIEEIARELKITETAAKVRVHRGRKMLKEMFYGGDG